ncbi:MAG: O-antigen ligase family protein [Gemmatimonadales bacterium]
MIPRPSIADRAALRVFQAGALAVVLAAAPYKAFDLDRFFVPKEFVLHATAVLVTVLCLIRARRLTVGRVDQLIGIFLVLGVLSALFSTNGWLAERSVAISLSGAACFWSARALARSGLARPLLAALALAAVLGAVTALLQAYGVRTDFVSLNRAPGGTFGNRNFMAHVCVIAFPTMMLVATTAPSRRAFGWWAAAFALVAGALILSRSRAAWLALIVTAAVLVPLVFIALVRGRSGLRLRRLLFLPVAAALGAAIALVLPNTLDWRSDSPYIDTAKSVVNYKEGSGHGRLVQYGNTLRMSLHHPILGVGPGNWAVVYPRFASEGDPSLAEDGTTSNPWPSSDWMTFVSERGLAAACILGLALLALVVDGLRGVRGADTPEGRLAACALVGTVAALLVVGTFDAVLLLPPPALVSWALLGALAPPSRERAAASLTLPRRALLLLVVAALGAIAVARSAAQLQAMSIFSGSNRTSQLERASTLDPGSYRIHVRLAEGYLRRGSCTRVRSHAAAARALFPNAPRPKHLLALCGR